MKKPKLIVLSAKDQDGLIERIQTANLPDSDKEILTGLIEFNNWLQFSLHEKSISINRLQNIFFGGSTESKKRKKKSKSDSKDTSAMNTNDEPNIDDNNDTSIEPETTDTENNTNKSTNSGRMSHKVYEQYSEVTLTPDVVAGDVCPDACGGRLTRLPPGMVVQVSGQGFAKVTKYTVEKLRCNLCGLQVNAPMPDDISDNKYDAGFKAQLCMLKYYMGMPFYRIEHYQRALGVPLPDATQWTLSEELANDVYPIFIYMEKLAATGRLIHADDTSVKIPSHMKEVLDNNNKKTRKGTFTTGILSYVDCNMVYLFYSSMNHAGENMANLLQHRPSAMPTPQYMCDALSRNVPDNLQVVLLNCLAHGRRKFVEIEDFFPPECGHVIDLFAKVYRNDAVTKDKNLSTTERLEYHQEHSKPIMDELYAWLNQQISERLVEPNSSLGKAIKYMLKHWEPLTQFLRVAGAPLDNNILEQILKIPIRIRKNSMFFATNHGAYVGSMLLSIICTCIAAKQNPVEYLTILQIHKNRIVKEPRRWMPWNYQDSILEHQMAA